jgi:VanZ family protein
MIRKNLFSITVALLLLYLSLANFQTFNTSPISKIPNIDKLVHFGMYFILMSVIILEHRKEIKNIRTLILISVLPLVYGIVIEILQMTMTSYRTGDFFDALFDALGVLAALAVWKLVKPKTEESIR